MTESPADEALGKLPRYAIFRGRKVRVSHYEDGKIYIIDRDDTTRSVPRKMLTFIK